MKYNIKRITLMLVMMLLTIASVLPAAMTHQKAGAEPISGPVVIIPVDRQIERGLVKFMERGFQEAADLGAELIILDIDTPGGLVDSADQIGSLVRDSSIPTLAYINGKAASAGSYIALNADKIVMTPGSMIGSAALVDSSGTLVEDPKLISAWKKMMGSAAESSGRNKKVAEGMVDINLIVEMEEIGETKNRGEIISLTSEEALKVGYADQLVASHAEAATWMGHSTEELIQIAPTWSENLASILTNPVVMTILLFLGIAGVVIELIVPGFGVPGIVGVAAFVLYFFGNYVAGFAGYETWILFIIGLILLLAEFFVPSFGVLGILGSISLIAGVIRAAYDTSHALLSLGIAFAAAAVVIIFVAIIFKERGIWNKFILSDSLTKEQGYVPSASKEYLIGQSGVSLTPLRPAGTVLVDGERLDVVTEGAFVQADVPVKIIKVEGTRIVVKPD